MPGESQVLPTTGQADPSVFTTQAIDKATAAERDHTNSIREVLEARILALEDAIEVERKRLADLREADQRAVNAALTAADKALKTAKTASDDHLKSHNDVLDGWRADRSTFITRDTREEDLARSDARFKRMETFQSRLLGGMGVLGAIGLGNLVKLWLS